MKQESFREPVRAGVYDAGSPCPACRSSIVEGDWLVSCPDCGSVQHERCWRREGCASYHCRKEGGPIGGGRVDIVITADELSRAPLPHRPIPQSYPFGAPKRATGRLGFSKLALFALFVSASATIGLADSVEQDVVPLLCGLILSILGALFGVIALVLVRTARKMHGPVPAGLAILISLPLMTLYLHSLEQRMGVGEVELQMSPQILSEESLARLTPAKANALRANVVVTCAASNFLPQMMYGSGIVVKIQDNEAFILTNRHVIGQGKALDIQIRFYNGEESKAEVEWLAPGEIDIAILSCPTTLPDGKFVEIEESLAAQGEDVFAVGNPMNLSWTYTSGVVSAIRENLQDERRLVIYQTQTPINYGNSGGGLYTMQGRLIGVNTWIQDKSITEGLSFAISTRSIVEFLRAENREAFFK